MNHVQSHAHRTCRIVGTRFRQSTHTIITIAENLYPHAMILVCEFVESSKQLVERSDEILGGAGGREVCETANVRKKDAIYIIVFVFA